MVGRIVGRGRGVLVCVGRASGVRSVRVKYTKGVRVRVGTKVGVWLAVGVGEGISEAVAVGAVEVGKGPSSACDVPASAVLVPIASPSSRGTLDRSAETITTTPSRKRVTMKSWR